MNLEQLINGENFKRISDVIIDTDTIHTWSNPSKINSIIFCKTDLLGMLFSRIRNCEGSYTLISSLSDYAIDKPIFESRPLCIKKWYAQNVDYSHPDLIPVPIGLENHKGPSTGSYTNWDFWKKYELSFSYQKDFEVYSNFCDTHQSRAIWRNKLNDNAFIISNRTDYNNYIHDLSRHKFCTSPRGNGIDCHRTWESLYVGTIPIVPKHFMYDSLPLPIIQVEDPSEITEANLLCWTNSINYKVLDKKSLTMDYWINRIKTNT